MSACNAKNGLSGDQGLRFWARQINDVIFKVGHKTLYQGLSKITRPHHQKVLGGLHLVWGVLA